MNKSQDIVIRILITAALLVFGVLSSRTVFAETETYTASTMRLLHYEGSVEIEDASGESGLVMENIRFNSGDSLHTGTDSSASVGLDSTKIVSLDEQTSVKFTKQAKALEMKLTEGTIFLDVQEKLQENETLDIKTSNMTVGIRGTVIYVSTTQESQSEGQTGYTTTTMGVLNGQTEYVYTDQDGKEQKKELSAGRKVVLKKKASDEKKEDLSVREEDITSGDIEGFIRQEIGKNPATEQRIRESCDVLNQEDAADSSTKEKDASGGEPSGGESAETEYPASGNWTYDEPVKLVAQSASKLYDGQPLTRTGDVLVYGLPSAFSIDVSAGGSITDAGKAENKIKEFKIYNKTGEDVTSHFKDIEEVSGSLVVDPAPLTVWTGSASRVYDGTPLTDPDTALRFYPGYEKGQKPWRNTSYVSTQTGQAAGMGNNQILYGVCGTTWVHGTNPITGESEEIELHAGEKLSVRLHDDTGNNSDSIEFEVIKIKKEDIKDIPEEIIRLYADNSDLLAQAAIDAGWDREFLAAVNERIQALSEKEDGQPERADNAAATWNGLKVDQEDVERLQEDLTNVRITIDTRITNYNDRALGSEEAHYTGVTVNDRVKVTATGAQKDVGKSKNTYKIDWNGVNPDNYALKEDLGILEVTPAGVTVKTGSDTKEYDGRPLTNDRASITGLVNGETASVKTEGEITDVGTVRNSCSIKWGSAKEKNYTVTKDLGTLEVTGNSREITFTASVTGKTYDGKPLTADSVTVEGLPAGMKEASVRAKSTDGFTVKAASGDREEEFSGFTYTVSLSGSRTDAGSSECTIDSVRIFDPDGNDVTANFTNIRTEKGTLTVTPAPAAVTTGSAAKEYDGTPLTSAEASITGLVNGETAAVTATGNITEVGTTENTYSIEWGTAKASNYTLDEKTGTLEVTQNSSEIIFTAASANRAYNGTALTGDSVTAAGIPAGFTYEASAAGSQTDAGNSESTVSAYKILNADGKDVTGAFTNIRTEKGTLTVTPAPAAVTTGSAVKEYDGTPLTSAEASITGLVNGETAAVTATGSITEVGTTENTYSIEWGTAKASNYTLDEKLGTLEIKAPHDISIVVSAVGDSTVTYDGKFHGGSPKVECELACTLTRESDTKWRGELSDGFYFNIEVTGGGTDAGLYDLNAVASTTCASEVRHTLTVEEDKLEILPAQVTVTTGSSGKTYDGTPLTSAEASITGLVNGETAAVTATGSITEVGTTENTSSIEWGTAKSANYTVDEHLGTLEVTALEVVFEPLCDDADYNGYVWLPDGMHASYKDGPEIEYDSIHYAASGASFTAYYNLMGGATVRLWCSGYKDAGTYTVIPKCTFESGNESNYKISFIKNEMTISPLEVEFDLGGSTLPYDGNQHGGDLQVHCDDEVFSVTKESSTRWRVIKETENGEDVIEVEITGGGTEPGEYTLSCSKTFASGKAGNYTIKVIHEKLVITPVVSLFSAKPPLSMPPLGETAPQKDAGEDAAAGKGSTAGENADTGKDTAAGEDNTAGENADAGSSLEKKAGEEVSDEPAGKTEGQASEKAAAKTEDKTVNETKEKSEEVSAEKAEKKAAEDSAEKTEKKAADDSAEKAEKKATDGSAGKAEKNAEESSTKEEKTESKPEEQTKGNTAE